MGEQTYGYIRVSSRDQHEDRQRIAMKSAGIPDDHVFMDKMSGKNFDRPGYQSVLEKLKPGDALYIKSIDRLGRNYDEILEQWRIITKEKRADIIVLDMPLLDTRFGKDLIGTLISDIVLQLLSYVAQTEREFIHQRQTEGIAAAKEKGVRFGRKPIERPSTFDQTYQNWADGKISARTAAKSLNISHQTFLRWAQESGPKSTL